MIRPAGRKVDVITELKEGGEDFVWGFFGY